MAIHAKTRLSKDSKMATVSQFLGFMLCAYDMALVLIMAPILAQLFPSPTGSQAWRYITIVFAYSITMVARPVGSVVFGTYADKIGRCHILVLTIGGVGLMSLTSALLPTYDRWGFGGLLSFVS